MNDSELRPVVRKALALLIASLPFPKDASQDLTTAWVIVLESEGVEPYQVEAAMADALKLEAFPPPIVFAKFCHRHRRALRLTSANCLPANSEAKQLPRASAQTIREQSKRNLETVREKFASDPNRERDEVEQIARVRQQIAEAKARRATQ